MVITVIKDVMAASQRDDSSKNRNFIRGTRVSDWSHKHNLMPRHRKIFTSSKIREFSEQKK